MKTVRKAAAILLILSLCMFSAAAYDSAFDNFIVYGAWMASTPENSFLSFASETDTWQGFMATIIGRDPDIFYKVTPDVMDSSDYYAITNLQGFLEENYIVEDNDVFVYIVANSINPESGLVPDGWLIASHYGEDSDSWNHMMYYFGIKY